MEVLDAPPSCNMHAHAMPRGPERFFYDTSRYTGCARYGGHTVVDGLLGPPDTPSSCSRRARSRSSKASHGKRYGRAAETHWRVAYRQWLREDLAHSEHC